MEPASLTAIAEWSMRCRDDAMEQGEEVDRAAGGATKPPTGRDETRRDETRRDETRRDETRRDETKKETQST